jgi:acetyl-CoA C-acetyltransferase
MIELNEAFAAQAIGCMRELGIETTAPMNWAAVFRWGIPSAATGARQIVTGMHQMQRKGYGTGFL